MMWSISVAARVLPSAAHMTHAGWSRKKRRRMFCSVVPVMRSVRVSVFILGGEGADRRDGRVVRRGMAVIVSRGT